jgi:peptide/nickel transport system substrate-binding protein
MTYLSRALRRWRAGAVGAVLGGLFLVAPAAAVPPDDTLVVAIGAEPETLLPRNACSTSANWVTETVYDRLTQLQPDGTVGGSLAESFEQVDPLIWQFKLRQDVTFSNGEPFNADTVVTNVTYVLDPANPAQCASSHPTLVRAEKVDEFTVNLITSTPDQTLPARMFQMYMVAPGWLMNTPDEELAVTAVGTGSYTLEEWLKGQRIVLRANATYWGAVKPTFDQVQLIARSEEAVRAAMVQSGEADMAINISQELAETLPQSVTQYTTETVLLRINTENPVLSDVRVRQAINLSIDRNIIMEALYPGITSDLRGQAVRESALGQNPDLPSIPYDPERAAQLVSEAGATGQNINIVIRTDIMPKVMELAEALQSMISQSGLQVTLQPMEAAAWRTLLWATQPGQERSDLLIAVVSNNQFDSGYVLGRYFGTGQYSHAGGEALQAKIDAAAGLTGEERVAAYNAIWQEVYDENLVVPLFGLDFIHGLSARVNWTPRNDGWLLYNTVTRAQ